MNITKTVLSVVLFFTSTMALAQSTKATEFMNNEAKIAEFNCSFIKQDNEWKNLIAPYSEMEKDSKLFPKNSVYDGDLAIASNNLYQSPRISMRLLDRGIDVKYEKKTETGKMVSRAFYALRINRVLSLCGQELYDNGLIILTKSYKNNEDNQAKFKKILEKAQCYKDSETKFIANVTKAESGEKVSLPEVIMDDCYETGLAMYNDIVFPFHDSMPESSAYFYKLPEVMKIAKEGYVYSDNVKQKLPKIAAATAQQNKSESEKQSRIDSVKKGNLKAANSCSEIGQSLINKDTVSHMLYGSPVSKNVNVVYANPDQAVFGSVNKVYETSKNEIVTFDPPTSISYPKATVIKLSSKTIWFNSNVATGGSIYVVGKYVDNKTLKVMHNNQPYTINARVIEPVCINSL